MLKLVRSRSAGCAVVLLIAVVSTACAEPAQGSDGGSEVLSALVTAIVSVVVAAGNWILLSRQQRRELDLQQRQMEAQLKEIEEKYLTPGARLRDWLDTLPESIEAHEDFHPSAAITPYTVGLPISDTAGVYGRAEMARTLLQRAAGGRAAACISVLGSRRAGKTTLLYYVRQPEVLRVHLSNWRSVVAVYVDLQAHYETPDQFFGGLLRATVRALEAQDGLPPNSPALPLEVDYTFISDFFSRIRHPSRRFLILLDELEVLAGKTAFGDGFFGRLRSLAQAEGSNMALVTTSYRSVYELGRRAGFGAGSPLFNIFDPTPIHVGPLTQEEALRLICHPASSVGVAFDQEDADLVAALAGRIPFNLQVAASLLYDAHRSGFRGSSLHAKVCERYRVAMEQHFAGLWRNLTDDERAILKDVMDGPKHLAGGPTVDTLTRYGFLESVDDDYRVLGSAFVDWIRASC